MAAIGEAELLEVVVEILDVADALEVVLWLRESLSPIVRVSKQNGYPNQWLKEKIITMAPEPIIRAQKM